MNNLAIQIGQEFFRNGVTGPINHKFVTIAGVPSLVTLIVRASFVFAGLILLFYFIMGGIGMMGSAGKNDPKAAEMAKSSITTAVTGFIVVFLAYWIVKLIGQLLNIPNLI